MNLSGGIDSALVARLSRDALGPDRVLGLLLPDARHPTALLEETAAYAEELGIEHRTIPIDPIERAFVAALPATRDRVDLGNVKARIRMTIAYAWARPLRRLVAGTGNRSELELGYFTKYGDGGVDLLPIGGLYKTQVRALARSLGLPKSILDRPPTAGLWEGQTDEGELGLAYEQIDRVLNAFADGVSDADAARSTGVPVDDVARLRTRQRDSAHKRRLPPIPPPNP